MENYKGKWALVTGASAGIGEEFAKQLAAKGANLILVARREEKLASLADELRAQGAQVKFISQDLTAPDAADKIGDQLDAEQTPVDILINNAGFGLYGLYVENRWEDQNRFLQLMVTSYAHLVHRFLPGMLKRNYGRIINVSSVAALTPPDAGHTLYAASKAFLVRFSQALAAETHGTEVKISALCPGYTHTEFHDATDTRDSMDKMPRILMKRVEPTVRGALKAVERRKTVYIHSKTYKFLVWLNDVMPTSMAERNVRGSAAKYRDLESV